MDQMDSKKLEAIERISSLPDCLLHLILSFLATKESVRTSVLSKRWINVWKSVACLELDFSDFNEKKTFKNFASSILHYKRFNSREQLDTFELTWHNPGDDVIARRTIKTWIRNLVSLKPRVVCIELSKLDKKYSFSCLFHCPTLEILFLCPVVDSLWAPFNPVVINLPFLKVLHLGHVLSEDEFIKRLIPGFPVLKDLMLEDCSFNVSEKIRSNTVTRFTILRPLFADHTILRFWIPSLVCLECEADLGYISFENLKSLEFASVTLQDMGIRDDYFDDEEVMLLKGLSNAKTIELCGSCVESMLQKEAPRDLPVFEKLEILHITDCAIFTNLEPLGAFLKRTPNLKQLTLERILAKGQLMMSFGRPSEIQCGNLKAVEIVCSTRDEQMHELVKSLLMRLKGIQNISITRVDYDSDDDYYYHE